MTNAEVVELYSNSSQEQKMLFLARISHELTIRARAAYEPGTENVTDPKLLRRINESQHGIAGTLAALLQNAPGYPDDVLVEILMGERESRRAVEHVVATMPQPSTR